MNPTRSVLMATSEQASTSSQQGYQSFPLSSPQREVTQEGTINEMMGFGHHTPTKSTLPGTSAALPTTLLREVIQEAAVNEMMGFGRHRKASMVPRQSGVIHYEVETFDPFSTPSRIASPRPGLAHIYLVPQQHWTEDEPCSAEQQEDNERVDFAPDLEFSSFMVGNKGSLEEPSTGHVRSNLLPRSLSPEDFFRSSSGYVTGFSTTSSPIEIQKPLTPYPGMGSTPSKRSFRQYASVPLPSSQQQAYINEAPRRASSVRKPEAPQTRLPADYRAQTPFSFTQPTTPTAFSVSGAPILTPGHPYYNAKRIGGVELEYRSLEKAAEAQTGIHRAMWPEEKQDMLDEVDEMARTLARNLGKVKDEERLEGTGETTVEEEEKKDGEKKKMGWLRRLVNKKKKESSTAVDTSDTSGRTPFGDSANIATDFSRPAKQSRRHSTSIIVPGNTVSTPAALAVRRAEGAFVVASSPVQLPTEPKMKKRQWWHLGHSSVKKES